MARIRFGIVVKDSASEEEVEKLRVAIADFYEKILKETSEKEIFKEAEFAFEPTIRKGKKPLKPSMFKW